MWKVWMLVVTALVAAELWMLQPAMMSTSQSSAT